MNTTKSPRRPKVGKSLADLRPDLAAEWDDPEWSPADVSLGAKYMAAWKCDAGHQWPATVSNRALRGSGCRTCQLTRSSRERRLPEPGKSLGDRFPEVATGWHVSLNAPLTPYDVHPFSHDKRWWHCESCDGPTCSEPSARVVGHRMCGVCVNKAVVKGVNDLASQYPLLAEEWDVLKNEGTEPDVIFCRSKTGGWWRCRRCKHSWNATPGGRALAGGTGCPACGRRGFNSSAEAILYFFFHKDLNAFKVGITGTNNRRLTAFTSRGWTALLYERFPHGADAMEVESSIHRWWRADLHLPIWLSAKDMGHLGGYTETISADELTPNEIITRIKSESARVRAAREVGLAG